MDLARQAARSTSGQGRKEKIRRHADADFFQAPILAGNSDALAVEPGIGGDEGLLDRVGCKPGAAAL